MNAWKLTDIELNTLILFCCEFYLFFFILKELPVTDKKILRKREIFVQFLVSRVLIFHIKKVGSSLFVDEREFFAWFKIAAATRIIGRSS